MSEAWSTEDLQELATICQEVQASGKTVNADTVTHWIKTYYPGLYDGCGDYPYGVIADGMNQLIHQLAPRIADPERRQYIEKHLMEHSKETE